MILIWLSLITATHLSYLFFIFHKSTLSSLSNIPFTLCHFNQFFKISSSLFFLFGMLPKTTNFLHCCWPHFGLLHQIVLFPDPKCWVSTCLALNPLLSFVQCLSWDGLTYSQRLKCHLCANVSNQCLWTRFSSSKCSQLFYTPLKYRYKIVITSFNITGTWKGAYQESANQNSDIISQVFRWILKEIRDNKAVEKRELLYTIDGNINWHDHYEK